MDTVLENTLRSGQTKLVSRVCIRSTYDPIVEVVARRRCALTRANTTYLVDVVVKLYGGRHDVTRRLHADSLTQVLEVLCRCLRRTLRLLEGCCPDELG